MQKSITVIQNLLVIIILVFDTRKEIFCKINSNLKVRFLILERKQATSNDKKFQNSYSIRYLINNIIIVIKYFFIKKAKQKQEQKKLH